jgi:hypothetical protein
MKLTFAKAEHLKRNATKSPELKQILSSLKPVLNDFVGEVQRSLGYFTNTHRDASIQYMMGLGSAFRLPGLQKFLSEKLQLDVRKLQKLERLVGDEVVTAPVYTENVLSFAVAYGLALQGLHSARLHTNLLPQEIRVERLIRAKKPWAVTAAAALLFGTAILAMGYNRQFVAVASQEVKEKMKKVDEVAATASRFDGEVKNQLDLIEKHKNAVKSIILGQEERLNWIQFNNFVNRALPKPDGSNLNTAVMKDDPKSAKQLFWNYNAQQTWLKFQAQQKGTAKAADKLDEEELRDDLVQANVESMYCVYTPSLSGYFNSVKADSFMWNTMSEKDQKNTPAADAKGWVVELRGYTYNRFGFKFVQKAIVENLARTPIHVATLQEVVAPPAEGASADAAKTAQQGAPSAGATAPQTSSASATSAPAAGATAAPGAAGEAAKDDYNQVSHVALYRFVSKTEFDPATFELINSRVADGFVGGTGGGAAGSMMMGAMGGGGGGQGQGGAGGPPSAMGLGGGGTGSVASTSGWSPLGSEGGGSGGAPGMGMGMGMGMGGIRMGQGGQGGMAAQSKQMTMPQMGAGMAGRSGFGLPMGGTGFPGAAMSQPEEEKKKKGVHRRTEFVILFVWREPTKFSDDLMPPEDTAAPASGGTGMGMGMGMGGGRN